MSDISGTHHDILEHQYGQRRMAMGTTSFSKGMPVFSVPQHHVSVS
jgi:hypothetical protein